MSAGLCNYVTGKGVVHFFFVSVGHCMHAADGFAAPRAMCGTVLRCCVKLKIAHLMTRTQQINVRFKTTDQTDESRGGIGISSLFIIIYYSDILIRLYLMYYFIVHYSNKNKIFESQVYILATPAIICDNSLNNVIFCIF